VNQSWLSSAKNFVFWRIRLNALRAFGGQFRHFEDAEFIEVGGFPVVWSSKDFVKKYLYPKNHRFPGQPNDIFVSLKVA
jgi:hypothetical protein